ncbi:MAG: prenyltransferase [Anaerolineaceae bacterium]|nr:prenyltransferase [Anaerolineaceae bacterium]
MNKANYILGPMRLPFLILAPACVFLGYASAVWKGGAPNALYVLLAVIGAVSAHISVNALNEYFDFKSGLDLKTSRTPFSGGSGTLPAAPEKSAYALVTGLISLAVTALIGLFFILSRGPGLVPVGLLGLLVILAYTPWFNRSPLLCLIAPGIGFGTCMILGTVYVLGGRYSWTAFFASLVPFFLVSNLLLLNQFPDVEADRSIGRKNYPILSGRKGAAILYGAFTLSAYLSILLGVALGYLPAFSLLGLLSALLAIPTIIGVYRNADDIGKLVPFMGFNVLITLITPVLAGIGLLLS